MRWIILIATFLYPLMSPAEPGYPFKKDESHAIINLLGLEGTLSLAICGEKTIYKIGKYREKNIKIPSNKRIILFKDISMSSSSSTAYYSAKCNVNVSLTPQSGQTYYMNTYVQDEKCKVEVVKQNLATLTGIEKEDSLQYSCNQK